MKDVHLSLKVFGVYLTILGLILALSPNMVLPILGFDTVDDVWIRLLGLMIFLLSCIYYLAINQQWISFYRLTIVGRLTVFVFMLGCVLTGLAPWMLILFGIIDMLGALWTATSLKYNHVI